MVIEETLQSTLEIMIPLTEEGDPFRSSDGKKVWLFVDLERSEDATRMLRREADRSTLNMVIAQMEVRGGTARAPADETSEQESLRQAAERVSAIGVQWRPIRWSERSPAHDIG